MFIIYAQKLRLSSYGERIATRDILLCAIIVLCCLVRVCVVVFSTVLQGVLELSMRVEMMLIGALNAAVLRGYYECV